MSRSTVVLVHGWPVTDHHWRLVRPIFDAAGLRTLMYSPPGLGASTPAAFSFEKRSIANALGQWLDGQPVDRVTLVGHDWGGTIGWMLAAQRPDLVRQLVVEEEILPGSDIAVPEPGATYYPSWHGPFNRVAGLAESLVPGRENAYYGRFLADSAGPAGLEPAAVRAYLAAYRTPSTLVPALSYYRTQNADIADIAQLRTRNTNVPTMAVGGRYAMGSALAESLRTVTSDVSEITLPLSGHYPAEQEPERFSRAVLHFLGR